MLSYAKNVDRYDYFRFEWTSLTMVTLRKLTIVRYQQNVRCLDLS